MNDGLLDLLLTRLLEDPAMQARAGSLVLAACGGSEGLEETLASGDIPRPEPRPPETRPEPARAYLRAITVRGFRGIGAEATLEIAPGPGLTLVIGRNGSGKSSFAEGLEVLLTGDNRRWGERSQIWKEGWRNLHVHGEREVRAELLVEGTPAVTRAWRRWDDGATRIEQGEALAQVHGRPRTGLDTLGWREPLDTFRPFLSYNELGSTFDKPSAVHDALSAVLGLAELVEARELLRQARLAREKEEKRVKTDLDPLLTRLRGLPDDERARQALQALSGRKWDLDTVERLVLAGEATGSGEGDTSRLQRWASLSAPTGEQVLDAAQRLRETAKRLGATEGTEASRCLQTAELLEGALALHASHGDADCPVCGTAGAMDSAWRRSAEREAAELRSRAESARQAQAAATAAVQQVRHLVQSVPVLEGAADLGLDAETLTRAWSAWADPPAEALALAEHLETRHGAFAESLETFRQRAADELQRRESRWRPLSADLAAWLGSARQAQAVRTDVQDLKAAETWMKETEGVLRDERFAPIDVAAREHWAMLRQDSNVELSRVALEGSQTQRRVDLQVTVDGVDGAALGVMSQGELNALALSLFLPRAVRPESPFGFVVIDDPVQSMDPARIDGLARVLEGSARTRQVIVFTHDDRLFEAVRRLGIEADAVEVTRRTNSQVDLRRALDPVDRALDDAWAVARSEGLDPEIARRVVPGFCRAAVEAACTRVVRKRRLERGDRHLQIEADLVGALTLKQKMALALFDDATRGGDVPGRVSRFGRVADSAYEDLNRGAHGRFDGDPETLASETRVLVRDLLAL